VKNHNTLIFWHIMRGPPAELVPVSDIPLRLHLCGGEAFHLLLDPSDQLLAKPAGTLKQLLTHTQAPPPRPVPAKDIPSHLRVCCGGLRGNFDVQRALVILDGGREVSPTEFERMAGKAASKKWKASVRIDKASAQSPKIRPARALLCRMQKTRNPLAQGVGF
jgi:hypothetical protein